MPKESGVTRENRGETIFPSDILLPEFSQEGLLAADGKLLIIFITQRCISKDKCFQKDLQLLNNLHKKGVLPSLSEGRFRGMDTPFVDVMDPEENVHSLGLSTQASLFAFH